MTFVSNITRRNFLTTSAAATAATFAPRLLFAQAPPPMTDRAATMRAAAATAKITTQLLRNNISVLMGSGGNIAVLPGPEGKLLVDSGFATSRAQIAEALNAISADPIQHLIDTHWHFDHTDGNEWMHSAGATIIAHERTRQRLSTPQVVAAYGMHFDPSPAGALPTVVFATDHTLTINGATILLKHYDPAHTDTDISVLFADADILHTGDTFSNGNFPFIDYSSGGHINGMIRAAERNMAVGTDSTILIPGHGPIGTKAQLTESHAMLVTVRDTVANLKKQGRTVDEVVAAKPTAQFDDKYGKGNVKGDLFTKLVYQGV
jgi:glyoxylase-like metal-dependent hydrolase (beta-lactamase superfamily II)